MRPHHLSGARPHGHWEGAQQQQSPAGGQGWLSQCGQVPRQGPRSHSVAPWPCPLALCTVPRTLGRQRQVCLCNARIYSQPNPHSPNEPPCPGVLGASPGEFLAAGWVREVWSGNSAGTSGSQSTGSLPRVLKAPTVSGGLGLGARPSRPSRHPLVMPGAHAGALQACGDAHCTCPRVLTAAVRGPCLGHPQHSAGVVSGHRD